MKLSKKTYQFISTIAALLFGASQIGILVVFILNEKNKCGSNDNNNQICKTIKYVKMGTLGLFILTLTILVNIAVYLSVTKLKS